jgi:hypothetical protein
MLRSEARAGPSFGRTLATGGLGGRMAAHLQQLLPATCAQQAGASSRTIHLRHLSRAARPRYRPSGSTTWRWPHLNLTRGVASGATLDRSPRLNQRRAGRDRAARTPLAPRYGPGSCDNSLPDLGSSSRRRRGLHRLKHFPHGFTSAGAGAGGNDPAAAPTNLCMAPPRPEGSRVSLRARCHGNRLHLIRRKLLGSRRQLENDPLWLRIGAGPRVPSSAGRRPAR